MSPVIDDQHEAQLKTILDLDESQELPENVVELYNEARRTMLRLGSRITEHELAAIILILNRAPRPEPLSFLDEARAAKVQRNERVLAKFRNTWRWGRYLSIDEYEKKILVELDDDIADARRFSPTSVRFPTAAELKAIGEKQ